jgi:hypothetical protein
MDPMSFGAKTQIVAYEPEPTGEEGSILGFLVFVLGYRHIDR